MMRIEIKNDKNAINDALMNAAIEGTKEYIKQALLPFESEIAKHDGQVTVNISNDLSDMSLDFKNLPQELVDKIHSALSQ
jgi:hypothetical protein